MAGHVVRVSNLPVNCQEADILEALSQFGPISYIKLEEPGIALVEFEESQAARYCLNSSVTASIAILGQGIYVTASQLPGIRRESKLESAQPTNCLIIFVLNASKPVTPKVIRTICERAAPVIRIAVHKEDVLFSLVEFNTPDEARRVKHQLNGCDIFSGCCTLKIEFANLSRVKIIPGDPNCYDSTGAEMERHERECRAP